MKSIISENIKRYMTDKRKMLLFAVFAFFCGAETGKAQVANMSLFEYVLFVMSNHYYIIYFMLMAYFFFLFDNMRDETNLMRVRLKTVRNQFISGVICIFIQSLVYVAVHFVIATAIGVIHPAIDFSKGFCVTPIDGYYNETIDFILEYSNYMKSPLWACVLTGMYMILGLTFMAMLIYILKNILGRKISLIAVGVMIINIMIGFKIGINGICGMLFLNNYFIYHHVLFGSGSIYLLIIICVEVVIVYCGLMLFESKLTNRNKRKNIYFKEMSKSVYKSSALFLAGYVFVNTISVLCAEGESTEAADVIFLNIAGYSQSNFYLFEFIKYLIYFMVPVYFVGMMSERERKLCNAQVAVRYGYKKWMTMFERRINVYLIKYCLIFLIILGTTAVVMVLYCRDGRGFCDNSIAKEFARHMNIDVSQMGVLILFAMIIRILELIYYKEIYMVIYKVTQNSIASFLVTFLGYVIAIVVSVPYISYGASSLYNFADDVGQYGMVPAYFLNISVLVIKISLLRIVRQKIYGLSGGLTDEYSN